MRDSADLPCLDVPRPPGEAAVESIAFAAAAVAVAFAALEAPAEGWQRPGPVALMGGVVLLAGRAGELARASRRRWPRVAIGVAYAAIVIRFAMSPVAAGLLALLPALG